MRTLILLFSLFGAYGPLLKLSGHEPLPPRSGVRSESSKPADVSEETLESLGLYPVFEYRGRPMVARMLVRQKERWQDLLATEEVKYYPVWYRAYEWKRVNRVLLVIDADDQVYVAGKAGFVIVGYVKKKGLIKRFGGRLKKGLIHGLETGPVHIVLGLFGIG